MTTLHFVKKSRKMQKDTTTGKMIPIGSSYYWWQFAFSPKTVSLTRPKPQQLTRSEYDATVMDIQDAIGELDVDDLESQVSSITESIENLKNELEDKLSNMPEQLQESSSSGELLTERIDTLDSWLSGIQGVDIEIDEESFREEVEDEVYNELLEELEDDFAEASAAAADNEKPQPKEMSDEEKEAAIRKKMKDKVDEINEQVQEKVDEALQAIIEEIQGFDL